MKWMQHPGTPGAALPWALSGSEFSEGWGDTTRKPPPDQDKTEQCFNIPPPDWQVYWKPGSPSFLLLECWTQVRVSPKAHRTFPPAHPKTQPGCTETEARCSRRHFHMTSEYQRQRIKILYCTTHAGSTWGSGDQGSISLCPVC